LQRYVEKFGEQYEGNQQQQRNGAASSQRGERSGSHPPNHPAAALKHSRIPAQSGIGNKRDDTEKAKQKQLGNQQTRPRQIAQPAVPEHHQQANTHPNKGKRVSGYANEPKQDRR
jgi:hypothetical protein